MGLIQLMFLQQIERSGCVRRYKRLEAASTTTRTKQIRIWNRNYCANLTPISPSGATSSRRPAPRSLNTTNTATTSRSKFWMDGFGCDCEASYGDETTDADKAVDTTISAGPMPTLQSMDCISS